MLSAALPLKNSLRRNTHHRVPRVHRFPNAKGSGSLSHRREEGVYAASRTTDIPLPSSRIIFFVYGALQARNKKHLHSVYPARGSAKSPPPPPLPTHAIVKRRLDRHQVSQSDCRAGASGIVKGGNWTAVIALVSLLIFVLVVQCFLHRICPVRAPGVTRSFCFVFWLLLLLLLSLLFLVIVVALFLAVLWDLSAKSE